MAYKHKYVQGQIYAWYNNSDDLEDTLVFANQRLDIVHADTFIPVVEGVAPLVEDLISGSDYRWYVNDFSFPNIGNGCYRFILIDTTNTNVGYISDIFEAVSSTDGLTYNRFRNGKNILNYNYEGLPSFYNKTHIELSKRKPLRPTNTLGYPLSSGSFNRVRTILTKSWEFITGWFDDKEHGAVQASIIHSDNQLAIDGNWEVMNLTEGNEYIPEWEDNYEFIQVGVRLQINSRSSSNKAL